MEGSTIHLSSSSSSSSSLVVFDIVVSQLDGDDAEEGSSHFLGCCFLCDRALVGKGQCDIYMYRGDTPFCSEECREVQIAMDKLAERRSKAARKTTAAPTTSSSSSSDAHQMIHARAAATALAQS